MRRNNNIEIERCNVINADRHSMWVERAFGEKIPSRTGRNTDADSYIYPHFVPSGTVRIEITSTGSLPETLSEEEFFEGFSIPRNQEMMRIFKDLDLVEHLGSGIPRILESYGKECFRFTENFTRMTFPNAWD